MMAKITSTLVAGILALVVSGLVGSGVLAQGKPDTGTGGDRARPGPSVRPPAAAPAPKPDTPAGDEGSSAQGDTPAGPGCPDLGRKLELIV